MYRTIISILIFNTLLLAGAGCPPAAGDQIAPVPTSQLESDKPSAVTEPFDTNDYLDAALAELEAVE